MNKIETKFGTFKRDEFDSCWEGTIQLSLFLDCDVNHFFPIPGAPYTEEDLQSDICGFKYEKDEDEINGIRDISLNDKSGNGIKDSQIVALQYLMDNPKRVELKIMSHLSEIYAPYLDEFVSDSEDDKTPYHKYIDYLTKQEKHKSLISFEGVTVNESEKDGMSHIAYDFNCAWDDEHGFSVKMLGDDIVEVSLCSEFYDC